MKIKGKKIAALFCIVCMPVIMAAGCGSDSADLKSANTDEQVSQEEREQEPEDSTGMDVQEPEEEPEDQEGRWHVLDPEVAAVVDADFSGTVWKTGEASFYIAEKKVMLEEDGSVISSTPSSSADIPDSDLIEVVFDESTRFYMRTVHENGESHEDADAGFSDLEKGITVDLKGSFEKGIFHAEEIRIVKVS